MSTLLITAQTPHGFKTRIQLSDGDIAARITASWIRAGFTDVKMENQKTYPAERAPCKSRIRNNIRNFSATIVALIPGLFSD